MADWFVCQHRFDEAFPLIVRAWETLDANAARRAQLGLEAQPAYTARWRLNGTLADAKWRVPWTEQRDVVLPPAEQVQTWLQHARRIRSLRNLEALAGESEDDRRKRVSDHRNSTESVLWAGLWTAACAWRYCHGELLPLVREFNTLYHEQYGSTCLALEERHWVKERPLAPDSPLYWHFEIVKQWLAQERVWRSSHPPRHDPLLLDELDQLHHHLRRSAARWLEGRADKIYSDGIGLDYRWMKGGLAKQARRGQGSAPAETSSTAAS
jgi:hypothetical protein